MSIPFNLPLLTDHRIQFPKDHADAISQRGSGYLIGRASGTDPGLVSGTWRALLRTLYCGDHSENRYFARFEAHPENEPPEGSSAQEKLVAFCDAIENFPPSVMDLWKRSTSRVIDLGYQSEDHCPAFHDSLQPAILQRLAALGIELAITIYPQSIRNSSSISLVD